MYFSLLDQSRSSDFSPILCCSLCQGFFALFIKLVTQTMLTLSLQFCLQSKLVVPVRKAKLRKWQHTDHLPVSFLPNFLRKSEGVRGLFSVQPVNELLNLKTKLSFSYVLSFAFNLDRSSVLM